MPDLDALLDRIGLSSAPPPTLDGLRTVHRAYVSRVPYEDLAVQLGESGPLEVDAIAVRLLGGGRGGYCFELNGVLAWMLEALGFPVERHEGIVGPRHQDAPTNHLALVVHLDGERWLADAGLGEGPLDPLPLTPGPHGSPLSWTMAEDPAGGWWFGQHPYGSVPGFHVAEPVVDLAAFAPHHRRLSTDPASSFVQTLIVQRPYADRIVTLRARTLRTDGPDGRQRRLLGSADELADTLQGEFGIDPDALGPARIARLWDAAVAQHESWLATQATAGPAEVR